LFSHRPTIPTSINRSFCNDGAMMRPQSSHRRGADGMCLVMNQTHPTHPMKPLTLKGTIPVRATPQMRTIACGGRMSP
jgi:hypothetical protein